MKIIISDWAQGPFLRGTKYTHGQEIEGTDDDAITIASELFKLGRNVMLYHNDSNIAICVDHKHFQQR
jgi:hypothetical protein